MTINKSDRPSLYAGSSSSPGHTAEVFNILSGLEPAGSSGKSAMGITLIVLALLIGAGALVMTKTVPIPQFATSAKVSGPETKVVAATPPAPAPDSVVPPIAETFPPQPGIARIVADEQVQKAGSGEGTSAASVALNSDQNATAQTTEKQTEGSSAINPLHVATASADKKPESEAKPDELPSQHQMNSKVAQSKAPTKAVTAKPPVSHTKISKHTKSTAVHPKNDRDADLIAALLTRVSRADKSEKTKAARSAAGTRKQQSAAKSSAKQNQDIVVRRPDEPLGPLVERCRALGLVEGELCRIRICSGNWGKDVACPANASSPTN